MKRSRMTWKTMITNTTTMVVVVAMMKTMAMTGCGDDEGNDSGDYCSCGNKEVEDPKSGDMDKDQTCERDREGGGLTFIF
jgi:hypothetical protein